MFCSLWMCTWSLAVSMGAATLLPFSVIGSEIMQAYPDSYYFQWLNWPLIHSLWNYIFALSNLSLFILLPFAYFFIESQGFKGHRKVMTFCIPAFLFKFLKSLIFRKSQCYYQSFIGQYSQSCTVFIVCWRDTYCFSNQTVNFNSKFI